MPSRQLLPLPTSTFYTSDTSSCYVYELSRRCRDLITRHLGQNLTNPDDTKMRDVNRSLLALAFYVGGF